MLEQHQWLGFLSSAWQPSLCPRASVNHSGPQKLQPAEKQSKIRDYEGNYMPTVAAFR